jgi:uncharacterized protein YjcR
MQVQIVSAYKRLLGSVADIIDVSGYRNDYIAKKLGLKPQNFSAKKQRGNWTPDELEQLLKVIENEDVENYLMLEQLRSLKEEETMTLAEFKKEMGWK